MRPPSRTGGAIAINGDVAARDPGATVYLALTDSVERGLWLAASPETTDRSQ
jgi:hypothetical protein